MELIVGKRGKEAPDGVMQQRLSVSGAANGSPRPHASRRPESATKPSVGDMRYQYAMRCDAICRWLETPGVAQVSVPFGGCCHGGAEYQDAGRDTGPPVLELEIPVYPVEARDAGNIALLRRTYRSLYGVHASSHASEARSL
jgi:hypothetical protein